MGKQGRKNLLLLDNAPSHPDVALNNVDLKFFPPNTTSRFQPIDQGITQAVQRKYRKRQLKEFCRNWRTTKARRPPKVQLSCRPIFWSINRAQQQWPVVTGWRNSERVFIDCAKSRRLLLRYSGKLMKRYGAQFDQSGTKGAWMCGMVEVTITSLAFLKKIFSGTRSDGRNFLLNMHFDKERTSGEEEPERRDEVEEAAGDQEEAAESWHLRMSSSDSESEEEEPERRDESEPEVMREADPDDPERVRLDDSLVNEIITWPRSEVEHVVAVAYKEGMYVGNVKEVLENGNLMLETRNPLAAFRRAYQRQLKAVGQGTILPLHKLRVAWDCFSQLLAIEWDAVFKCAEYVFDSSNAALFEKLRGDTPILVEFLHGVCRAEGNRIPDDVSALVIDMMDRVSLPFRHKHDNSVYPLPEEEFVGIFVLPNHATCPWESVFEILISRFNRAPRVVVCDNACRLHQDCLNSGTESDYKSDAKGQTWRSQKAMKKMFMEYMKPMMAKLNWLLTRKSARPGERQQQTPPTRSAPALAPPAGSVATAVGRALSVVYNTGTVPQDQRTSPQGNSGIPLGHPGRGGSSATANRLPRKYLGERVRAIVPEIFSIQDLITNNTYGTHGYGQLNSNALEAIYELLAAMEDTATSPEDRQFRRTVNTCINKKAKSTRFHKKE
ncbi:Hypp8238 [Branchiostoma lanceolatum]|uniref:Hypp8238 protein n=1 Tax=Branchiostoma lanceolatum TaxID=7740 RepID=A0A8J9Z7F0_BRALA|nr:Hypp8238 [Branchiostoma lanceolatum]